MPIICSICICKINANGDVLSATTCGHVFHEICIDDYIKKPTGDKSRFIDCPVCKMHLNVITDVGRIYMSGSDSAEEPNLAARHIPMSQVIKDLQTRLDTSQMEAGKLNQERNGLVVMCQSQNAKVDIFATIFQEMVSTGTIKKSPEEKELIKKVLKGFPNARTPVVLQKFLSE